MLTYNILLALGWLVMRIESQRETIRGFINQVLKDEFDSIDFGSFLSHKKHIRPTSMNGSKVYGSKVQIQAGWQYEGVKVCG